MHAPYKAVSRLVQRNLCAAPQPVSSTTVKSQDVANTPLLSLNGLGFDTFTAIWCSKAAYTCVWVTTIVGTPPVKLTLVAVMAVVSVASSAVKVKSEGQPAGPVT